MNVEEIFAQRASRHAALADATRLEIVDLLSLGDWSPSELERRLGTSSNLLAHHLNVLERAGLARRSRSEGDRRRSYVSLDRAALDALSVGASVSARRVVFVCSANSARSQLAAALWNEFSDVPAASGGTHPAKAIEPEAVQAARRRGLSLAGQRPRQLSEVRAAGDYIVTVCDTAHEELALPEALHWSIPDPVRSGQAPAFDAALHALERRVTDLVPRIAAA